MSKSTKEEVKFKRRWRYARAVQKHKGKLVDHAIDLFDYHRKAANPAMVPLLNARPAAWGQVGQLFGLALKFEIKARLNPFAPAAPVEANSKGIEAIRRGRDA